MHTTVTIPQCLKINKKVCRYFEQFGREISILLVRVVRVVANPKVGRKLNINKRKICESSSFMFSIFLNPV